MGTLAIVEEYVRNRDQLSVISDQLPSERVCADHGSLITDHAFAVKFVSEPDRGIYDAMNKGLRLASGDIIGILNADDFYPSPDILAKVAKVFEDPMVEACYGDLLYVKTGDQLSVISCLRAAVLVY